MLVILALVAIIGNLRRGNSTATWFGADAWFLALSAVVAWSVLTAMWSPAPGQTITKASLLLLFLLSGVFATRAAYTLDTLEGNRWTLTGLLTAVIGALAILGLEVFSDQYLAKMLLELFPSLGEGHERHFRVHNGDVVWVSVTTINRRMTVLAMLFWPTVAACYLLTPARLRAITALVVGAAILIVVTFSHHQSSQLAIWSSIAVFGLALHASRATWRILAMVWIALLVLALPLAKVPYGAGWHQAPWLFESARHRVIIWNYFASKALERPLAGIGADATAHSRDVSEAQWVSQTPLRTIDPQRERHPHNVFLQAWYETGLVGVILLLAGGLVVIRSSARRLVTGGRGIVVSAAAAGLFSTVMITAAFSYSMWQPWYQALIMISVVGLASAAGFLRLQESAEN